MKTLAFGVTEYVLLAISLLVIIALLIVLFLSLRKKLLQRYALVNYFYPIIRKTAVYHDFYLINKLEMKLNNHESLFIDHVLFGNKYIYVINDNLYKGTLSGKPQDSKWILKNKQGEEEIIDSPFLKTKQTMQKLSLRTLIDMNTFIGITLVSTDTKITDLDVNDSHNFIIDTRDFMKLVLRIEGRDIRPLNPEELKKRVHEIDGLNLRREKGHKWPKKK